MLFQVVELFGSHSGETHTSRSSGGCSGLSAAVEVYDLAWLVKPGNSRRRFYF